MKRASILLKITGYLSWYCLLFFYCQLASSAPEKLTFYVGVPQSPPVIYKDELTGDFTGIVPDILNSLPNEHKVKIDYIQHNRTRGEDALYNHEVDATILTTEWAKTFVQEEVIYTPGYKAFLIKESLLELIHQVRKLN
jgi:ABC-type amino acid transport substrate-binding protein